MFRIFEKIKHCYLKLVAWSHTTFGNTKVRIEEKQSEVETLINLGYANNLEQIHKKRAEINEILHQEEVFWRQRSRAIWLPTGDKNTKFFYKRASQRKKKNQIDGLMYEGGVWRTGVENTTGVDERYFTNLFSTSHPTTVDEVLELVETIVTEDMNHSLIMHFASDEVHTALFQMRPSKSPRLDGMSPFFF